MEGMKKAQPITKAIKNRRNSSKIKAYSPFELHSMLKSFVFRNRLLFKF
jgi:hypothetical protein